MNPAFWDEVQRIYAAATEAPRDARAPLLDALCNGRPDVRSEVDALLDSNDRLGSFLEDDSGGVDASGDRWRLLEAVVRGALHVASGARDGQCTRESEQHRESAAARTLLNAAAFTGRSRTAAGAPTDDALVAGDSRSRVGQRIGHYQLVEWIGAGGMGAVFRARDLALGRDAAIKVLTRDVDRELRSHLRREAEASARLQHPAIATFYETGDVDGETFIAMEFVKGQTLRERLASGALEPGEALAMIRCLLQALAHAHAAGLLHRDIKPENIIVGDGGSAKLLDFSIAMPLRDVADGVTAAGGGSTVTARGWLVGTVGYLAPEQVTGQPLDERTDIFQVAAVAYEALTGKPAFGGNSAVDRLTALFTTWPDLSALASSGAPPGFAGVIGRALDRDAAARPASAAAMLRELEELGAEVRPPGSTVLAILDFANRRDDPAMDWVGAAIAECLFTQLSKLPHLIVVSRERLSARLAAGTPSDPVAVSLQLGCAWLIDGEIAGARHELRIRARLVDVATGTVVAEPHASGPLTELFPLQDRIARTLAETVIGTAPRLAGTRGTTVDAHECYTRARLLIDHFGKASLEDARVLLERAIALDERHVESLAALTMTYGLRAIVSPNPADYEAAIAYADRALTIDPGYVRAYAWKGYALGALRRLAEAREAYRLALEHDPNDTDALYFAAGHDLLWKTPPNAVDARSLLQRAVAIDPSHGMWWLALGTAHRCLDRLEEARYSFDRARALEGTPARFATSGAAAYVAEMLRLAGDLDDARRAALAGVEAAEHSDHAYRDTFRAHGLAVLGRIALDRHDHRAAEASFRQVLEQARGRPKPRACGHFVVQALAGLTRATGDPVHAIEAERLFAAQDGYNFDHFYGALARDSLFELALAAQADGREADRATLMHRTAAATAPRPAE